MGKGFEQTSSKENIQIVNKYIRRCPVSLITVGVWVQVCTQALSCVQLFTTPSTVACQAPLYMEFSR